jgi:hypothetical protein
MHKSKCIHVFDGIAMYDGGAGQHTSRIPSRRGGLQPARAQRRRQAR